MASGTDIAESYLAGKTAVEAAVSGVTDKMVAFACTRTEDGGYRCDTKLLDLSSVANYEKKVPVEWINKRGNDISDEFIRYALPLIQGETGMVKENGLPRFAKLEESPGITGFVPCPGTLRHEATSNRRNRIHDWRFSSAHRAGGFVIRPRTISRRSSI